jgi:hypothetical protein
MIESLSAYREQMNTDSKDRHQSPNQLISSCSTLSIILSKSPNDVNFATKHIKSVYGQPACYLHCLRLSISTENVYEKTPIFYR